MERPSWELEFAVILMKVLFELCEMRMPLYELVALILFILAFSVNRIWMPLFFKMPERFPLTVILLRLEPSALHKMRLESVWFSRLME